MKHFVINWVAAGAFGAGFGTGATWMYYHLVNRRRNAS